MELRFFGLRLAVWRGVDHAAGPDYLDTRTDLMPTVLVEPACPMPRWTCVLFSGGRFPRWSAYGISRRTSRYGSRVFRTVFVWRSSLSWASNG